MISQSLISNNRGALTSFPPNVQGHLVTHDDAQFRLMHRPIEHVDEASVAPDRVVVINDLGSDDVHNRYGSRNLCGHTPDPSGMTPHLCTVGMCPVGKTTGQTVQMYRVGQSNIFPLALIIGPHWIMMCITYSIIVIPSAFFFAHLRTEIHIGLFCLSVATFILLLGSFSVTAFSDPGYVPKQSAEELQHVKKQLEIQGQLALKKWQDESQRCESLGLPPPSPPDEYQLRPLSAFSTCEKCNILRDPGCLHCYSCGVCVQDLGMFVNYALPELRRRMKLPSC